MNKESGIDTSIAGPSDAVIIISDTETDSSSDGSIISPPAKKVKKQAFCAAWLKDPQFQLWLQETEHPFEAKCRVCVKYLTTSRSVLKSHASTMTHRTNMQRNAGALISVPSDAATTSIDTSVAGPSSAAIISSDAENDSSADVNITGPSSAAIAITSSNVENVSSTPSTFIAPPAKKVKRRQAFRQDWLEDPEFKPWLQQVQDNPYKGKCIICCKYIVAGKTDLLYHANSRKHYMNMQHRKGPLTNTVHPIRSFLDDVKIAEIRFCIDMIEHNTPFHSFKQFIKMTKTPIDPDIAAHICLKRNKITAIVQNVINKSVILETTEILHGKLFSVLIEETTDVSDKKILWFLIRYFHKGQICTYLLDSIRIKKCTAENLHKCFLHSLKENNLPLSNIIGVCADNTNVMMGRQNSLLSRLLADNEEISVFSCIYHSMNLVASNACKQLPSHVDEFLHSIFTYFFRKPKHQSVSEGMQDFINFAKQKALQLSRTRWLALSESVERVLNQWSDLFAIFAGAVTEGKSKIASKIFRNFNCPYTKAYVQFLNYVLNTFTVINRLFQSSKVLIHCLLPESLRLLRLLGGNFIKSEYITAPNIPEIDVYNEANLLPIRTIYIGAEAMATINEIMNSNLEDQQITEFYTNIKKFYQSAFENIVRRLPFNEPFLNSLEFLNPHIALDITSHQNDQLNCILSKFKSKFNCNDVLNEWRLLRYYFSLEEKANLKVLDIPEFWYQISNTNDISGKYMFKNISKLAQLCLSLPHSNADVERFLSIVTEVKTKERSNLKPQTVAALARIKFDLTDKNVNSFDYKITDKMLNLFNSNMYEIERIPKELAGILLSDEADKSDNEASDN